MALFKATIEVLVEAKDEGEAADAVSEALRPLIKDYPDSGWKDWQYCRMHDGEYQRDPGPKKISKEKAIKQFDEFEG